MADTDLSTGITPDQRHVLVDAWKLVKPDVVTHGTNIFLKFFEKNPEYLGYFDFSMDYEAKELKDNRSLHAHALNVMNFFGAIIDYGLDHPIMYKSSLSKMVINHKRHGVSKPDVAIVCAIIKDYCLQTLGHSDELEDAFTALLDSVANAFD
ncbi:AAEL010322-PA [Aedes aegypti]|uniref:AAEL010322-PA n=2 Tax=Aedes aegypti TaxID=7159 RepID=A0A1S4FPX3_AEDAE|nr:hemoglobin-2 [Aedes aegypti]EAT37733.1 AAEL010322-PA [Aedes aegypti]